MLEEKRKEHVKPVGKQQNKENEIFTDWSTGLEDMDESGNGLKLTYPINLRIYFSAYFLKNYQSNYKDDFQTYNLANNYVFFHILQKNERL